MTTPESYLRFPPLEARLTQLELAGYTERIHFEVKLPDGTALGMTIPGDSQAASDILELFSRLLTEKLSEVGGRGVVVTEFASADDDE